MAKAMRMEPSAALIAMRLEDGDHAEPPPPGPPAPPLEPLVRFQPPPADWREEERLRAERDGRPSMAEVETSTQTRSVKPKPSTSKTPNLDRVREWMGGKQ